MEEFVFFIEGKVDHPLTIDPSVWIFDERKVDLTTYFSEERTFEDQDEAYTKAISEQWDKEIIEGSTPPRPDSNDNKINYNKKELTTGSFGMPLAPFIKNVKPKEEVSEVIIEQLNGEELTITYEEAVEMIVGFSQEGRPLKETGPIHLYFGDGSNQASPITHVKKLTLK
ncbi:peptidyl-prolyl cis-trans isomerase [Alkalihalophilus lindianensis]|uniref:Peptidyl-prolyl cis-trans isomerase n=1 Tax=Alkalihalophilus lindianensis TaxID=1630542 RepID=A0ABU3XBL3_9BACI|nr:peptidyl-prolyl cis-trans isomerase [Alkalihalophilus lindianensis]MDV2685285.1 peptidyl-prolyl cis-trans isomerase [Alkalihalophilus lindianensis]